MRNAQSNEHILQFLYITNSYNRNTSDSRDYALADATFKSHHQFCHTATATQIWHYNTTHKESMKEQKKDRKLERKKRKER